MARQYRANRGLFNKMFGHRGLLNQIRQGATVAAKRVNGTQIDYKTLRAKEALQLAKTFPKREKFEAQIPTRMKSGWRRQTHWRCDLSGRRDGRHTHICLKARFHGHESFRPTSSPLTRSPDALDALRPVVRRSVRSKVKGQAPSSTAVQK